MEVNKVSIDGRSITIEYQSGQFNAVLDGDLVKADTEKALVEKLRARLRTAKARLNLPITLINVVTKKSKWGGVTDSEGIGVKHVIITGLHAQNGDLLIEDADGAKHRKRNRSWAHDGLVCRRLTNTRVDEYLALARAKESAKKALEAFEARYRIEHVDQWVAKELAAAVDQVAEPDVEETGDPRVDAPAKKKAKR